MAWEIPSDDVTRATCVCVNECVFMGEHRRNRGKLDSEDFHGSGVFVTGVCGSVLARKEQR